MQNIVDSLAALEFGMTRTSAHKQNICVKCKGSAHSFKDKLSAKEYTLSGFCQKCQDQFFGGD